MTSDQKLDRLIQLMEGDGEDAPGVISRLGMVETILYGKDRVGGIVQEHRIMWRIHVWLLCSASACLGFVLKWGLDHMIKP